jgi:hypothetical protein
MLSQDKEERSLEMRMMSQCSIGDMIEVLDHQPKTQGKMIRPPIRRK